MYKHKGGKMTRVTRVQLHCKFTYSELYRSEYVSKGETQPKPLLLFVFMECSDCSNLELSVSLYIQVDT